MSNSGKKILIISPFFYPEPISTGKFNTSLALALNKRVESIKVLCFHPFYPKWKVQPTSKSIEDVEVIRGGKRVVYPKNSSIRRIILELHFTLFVFIKYWKIRNEVNTIIPVFPPSLAFYFIKWISKRNKKVITIVHDLQHVYISDKRGLKTEILKYLINRVEKSNFRFSDKIIFLSNEMKEIAVNHYNINDHKVAVKYPFITIDSKATNELKNVLRSELHHVVYSGALGDKQNPNELYSFFNYASKKIENVNFHFFSEGTIYETLKMNNSNEKIKFHNLVKEKNLYELYQRSSVQIIPQLSNTSKGSLPSKLPNLLVSGCNILAITDEGSEIDKLFSKYNLGRVATKWSFDLLLSQLKGILEMDKKENSMQISVAKKLFDIELLVEEIITT